MKNIVNNRMMQAESDLDSAKYNFKGRKLDVAAYLCQQSVEKGLKAVYLKKTNELWKTHDLVKLGALINVPEKIIKICNDLNPIYVEDRYPDFSDIIPAKIIKELKKFKERNNINKLIFFGSRLNNKHNQYSDIDLIVVSPRFRRLKSYKRAPLIRLNWNLNYPVDMLYSRGI